MFPHCSMKKVCANVFVVDSLFTKFFNHEMRRSIVACVHILYILIYKKTTRRDIITATLAE